MPKGLVVVSARSKAHMVLERSKTDIVDLNPA